MKHNLLLPFDWIVDSTRGVDEVQAYDSAAGALHELAYFYRQRMWTTQSRRVECWVESDSAAGIFQPIIYQWGVPQYSARGQAGKKLVYDAAVRCVEIGKPLTVLYFGDHDSTGVVIPESIEGRRERYSGGVLDVDFIRLGATPEDVTSGRYATHQANERDPNYKTFRRYCQGLGLDPTEAMEFEAIPAPQSRTRLEQAIRSHIEWDAWHEAQAEQERNQAILDDLAELSKDSERLLRLIEMARREPTPPPRRVLKRVGNQHRHNGEEGT
jgi:hypothetical protein